MRLIGQGQGFDEGRAERIWGGAAEKHGRVRPLKERVLPAELPGRVAVSVAALGVHGDAVDGVVVVGVGIVVVLPRDDGDAVPDAVDVGLRAALHVVDERVEHVGHVLQRADVQHRQGVRVLVAVRAHQRQGVVEEVAPGRVAIGDGYKQTNNRDGNSNR